MFGHLETEFMVIHAEQHLADRRATKLGPLLAEVERTPTTPTKDAGPRLPLLVDRLTHQLRAARLKWTRVAAELRPSVGQ